MNSKVTKAVIPAAGLGTRFLPATAAMPKEMLPLVDIPAIQLIVQEAVDSGIKDILIITGRGKRAIEDHFDIVPELYALLEKKGYTKELDQLKKISSMANIHYIRQKQPLGLGHAILCAEDHVSDEPFLVMLGDHITVPEKGSPPVSKQLMQLFEKERCSVIASKKVPKEDVSKYGIIQAKFNKQFGEIKDLVEKPSVKDAPSDMAITARYVLTPSIFDEIKKTKPGVGGEIQLTDAIKSLLNKERVLAYPFKGINYDVGNRFGYVQNFIDFALQRPDLRDKLIKHLKELHNNDYA